MTRFGYQESEIRCQTKVVILCLHNEKGTVAAFINDVFDQEKNSPGWKFELLIVDVRVKENKDYVELWQKIPIPLLENESSGLGAAVVQKGYKYAIEHFHPDALSSPWCRWSSWMFTRLLKKTPDRGYNLPLVRSLLGRKWHRFVEVFAQSSSIFCPFGYGTIWY